MMLHSFKYLTIFLQNATVNLLQNTKCQNYNIKVVKISICRAVRPLSKVVTSKCFVRIFDGQLPVSYTHLDVYKRQTTNCVMWRLKQLPSIKKVNTNYKLIVVKRPEKICNIGTPLQYQ